jgi:hypothetical protein
VNKPVLGLALGGVLGILDGLSALISAPETAPQIVSIVVGSTVKGLIVGVLIGWFAKKVNSLPAGLAVGRRSGTDGRRQADRRRAGGRWVKQAGA